SGLARPGPLLQGGPAGLAGPALPVRRERGRRPSGARLPSPRPGTGQSAAVRAGRSAVMTHESDHDPLLLLASASAGRRATLRAPLIDHAVLPVALDEEATLTPARRRAEAEGSPLTVHEPLRLLAREKAPTATARSEGGYVVLGGDSMLELDGEPSGKPHTAEKAARQWRAIRGRTGTLHSGHWLIDDRDPA